LGKWVSGKGGEGRVFPVFVVVPVFLVLLDCRHQGEKKCMVCCCGGEEDMGSYVKRTVGQGVSFLRELSPLPVKSVTAWKDEGEGSPEDLSKVSLGEAVEVGTLWRDRGALVYMVRRMG